MTSGSDSLSRSNSESAASSAPEEHLISVDYYNWGLRIFAARPKIPLEIFDPSVDRSIRDAREKEYAAEAEAAMKEVLAEYKIWLEEHDHELWEWYMSCRGDEEPDLTFEEL
ncbi:uncharacterized protein EV420DRAFT_1649374 [Desarmillaria tabescens]|uniref:Uncharacterized protein n=1 Tax=Armillaria tabescens TaxID=1929756 RepID=A0AA39MR20_ARMTA|nr:uncharacterized protein EV420DRAFT_1649374 [Desarmillaria tabescens]KAK0443088.1 hypothetical protein EV420DRAFT_1649374 [Desarmillaria tabescens]